MRKKAVITVLVMILALSTGTVFAADESAAPITEHDASAAPITEHDASLSLASADSDLPASRSVEESAAESSQSASDINNCKTSIVRRYSKPAVITASVRAGKVQLQRYDGEKWVTAAKASPKNGKVSFTIPKKYRKKAITYWRLYIPSTKEASDRITVTTQNHASVDRYSSTSCIYCVEDDTYIYDHGMNKQRKQASMTKLMTAMILLESGKADGTTTVSSHAVHSRGSYGIMKAGDRYRTQDLMSALLIVSANDAAVAIAEKVSGSESKFAAKMNKKAKEMGLENTYYKTASGLDTKGHYSSAADVAKTAALAYTYPEIRKCFSTRYKTIKSLKYGTKWKLKATDRIVGYDKNFRGGKTGNTPGAGNCFAGIYKYKGKTYVTVVMNCSTDSKRWKDTKALHKYIKKYS